MPNSIFRTDSLRVENAANFVRTYTPLGGAIIDDTHLYCGIGREDDPVGVDPDTDLAWVAGDGMWDNDSTPPVPDDTGAQDLLVWAQLIAAQKIPAINLTPVVPYRDSTEWVTGTVFDVYDTSSATLFTTDEFYCINNNFEVFILVEDDAVATPSTTQPQFASGSPALDDGITHDYFADGSSSIITTSEGLTWKYLYTLQSHSITTLLKSEWLPVNFGLNLGPDGQDILAGWPDGKAYKLMGARYVLMTVELDAGVDGSGQLPEGLNYRQVSFIKNPQDEASGDRVTSNVAYLINTVNVDLTGDVELQLNSGEIVYIENKSPITRVDGQTEIVNVVVQF